MPKFFDKVIEDKRLNSVVKLVEKNELIDGNYLAKKISSEKIAEWRDQYGRSLLNLAIHNHNAHNVEVLLKYVNPNTSSENCFISLCQRAKNLANEIDGNAVERIVKALQEKECDLPYVADVPKLALHKKEYQSLASLLFDKQREAFQII